MSRVDISDQEWPASIRAGDERAFAALFTTYYEPLCRYVFRYTQSIDVAEDLVQGVFAGIWEMRDRWQVRGSLRGYLYGAVRHQLSSRRRDQAVRDRHAARLGESGTAPSANPSWQYPPAAVEEEELRTAIRRVIAALPPKAREAFELSRRDGLSYTEIAEVMGISRKTVEVHIGRALAVLRPALAAYLSAFVLLHCR
jgi:RNA polymerase sigma-70 factor, ECF subfamily